MCGIVGYAGHEPVDPGVLRSMCDAIRHRGPDGEGYLVDDGIGLGMRRLAIIDVARGDQPIFNEDRTVAVVFNGEIYNFPELRRRLEGRGHHFATGSDTECIVHLYEDYGERCVDHLRGMFAFALWDARRRRLVLARDRVGKKPLYYRLTGDAIWFGSELKALAQIPGLSRCVDPIALHHYLTYQYVPAPWSIFEGVQKLPPGHVLVHENGRARLSRYWRLSYAEKLPIGEHEAADELMRLLREATAIRLVSERPVGAFLSGGIDSSLVVAAMAERCSAPVRTFSIGFEDKRFDERRYARLVAERFGTEHHELLVQPSALEILPELTWHYDEPFADSSAIPSLYLARMTREQVTVALNGDGGDESFGGYERYAANLMASRLRIPASVRRVVTKALNSRVSQPRTFRSRVQALLASDAQSPERRYMSWICHFNNTRKAQLYTDEMREATLGVDSYDIVADAFARSDAHDPVDRMLGVDVNTYLPGDLLVKMDIATMANSLETRSPFLDHHVMEFAASLPARMKISRRGMRYQGKHLMKRVARGLLPDAVLDRRKMGFGVPMAAWLRGELRDLAHDALTDTVARQRGYFDSAAVSRVLAEHDAGINHSTRIWNLLQFELWHRTFADSSSTRRQKTPAGERASSSPQSA